MLDHPSKLIWSDTEKFSSTSNAHKFFRRRVVIIDCSDIFMERPSDLSARTQVWSNYKQHSTVKLLIGITPQGFQVLRRENF